MPLILCASKYYLYFPTHLKKSSMMLKIPSFVVGFEKMNNSTKRITSVMMLPPFFKWYPERFGLSFSFWFHSTKFTVPFFGQKTTGLV